MNAQIEVTNISKRYQIGKKQRYLTLRDSFSTLFRHERENRDFWALKDVTFTVNQGEVMGVIGSNGAGKSTLLKILSRITYPTTGLVKLRGRISSLLEVGTGFNQELTGRENIFLNGAILGMRQKEIKKKFDEIVDFSGVEKFLDTPVKHYSSGMYIRLAFAVAAHLDSDIMMVDEVLAVGDSEFQKKSLGKMKSVSQSGKTIFFVSHNVGAIAQLCNRCLLFDKGNLASDSNDVTAVISEYLKTTGYSKLPSEWMADSESFLKRAAITDEGGKNLISVFANNSNAYVTIDVKKDKNFKNFSLGYALYLENAGLMYWSPPINLGEGFTKNESVRFISKIPQTLVEGRYRLEIIAMDGPRQWLFQPGRGCPTIGFEVQDSLSEPIFGAFKHQGLVVPQISWKKAKV